MEESWRIVPPRAEDPTPHFMTLLSTIMEITTRETLSGEMHLHFGGVIEIVRGLPNMFDKLRSATFIVELIERTDKEVFICDGNYLNFAYFDDILVFRRFGGIRGEAINAIMGSDYLIGTVAPMLRIPAKDETSTVINALASNTTFNDSIIQCQAWIDPKNLADRRYRISTPNHEEFRVYRKDDHFSIFRSERYLHQLADRLNAAEVK